MADSDTQTSLSPGAWSLEPEPHADALHSFYRTLSSSSPPPSFLLRKAKSTASTTDLTAHPAAPAMSEDGSWWRRLGAAFQIPSRSELTLSAPAHVQPTPNVGGNLARAQNTGVGFAALSVRSTASHRHRRSALENVRTTSNSHLTVPSSDLGPPLSLLPARSPSTPPDYHRTETLYRHQHPRSCPSSPPRITHQPQPRSSSQPISTARSPSPQLSASTDLRPGGSPQPPWLTTQSEQILTPKPRLPPQRLLPPEPRQLQSPSPKSSPARQRHYSTIAKEDTRTTSQSDRDETKTPTSLPPAESLAAARDLRSGKRMSSPGPSGTSGYGRLSPGSPFSTTARPKRSTSLSRPVSVVLSSPVSLSRASQHASPPLSYPSSGVSKEAYYHQRTNGGHILMHPSHRRRASSAGSLAEAANLLATRNQYTATLTSLVSMGYSKRRAEEALWKHPTKAAAYLEHQDHAAQDLLVDDCDWCIPWLGLAHLIEVGSAPKKPVPKPKPQERTRPDSASRQVEKQRLFSSTRESGSAAGLPAKQDTPSPSKTDDSEDTEVSVSTPTKKRTSVLSHAGVYSQDTTADSIVPVIGHANGESCQICLSAVGGVCQWSDWGWEHGKWEHEFYNEDD